MVAMLGAYRVLPRCRRDLRIRGMREDGTRQKGVGEVESNHGEGCWNQGLSAMVLETLHRCKLP
jgi:hypothetical protein